jgi:hypothetical protein
VLRPLAMFVFFTVLLTTRADAQVEEPLKLIHEISMPDFHDGDFDHFAKTWVGIESAPEHRARAGFSYNARFP